jgi:hypothetical protein
MSAAELRTAVAAPGARPAEGFTSRYVSVRGLRPHVRERAGSGPDDPPWVLLHGLAVSHRYLMPTAAALPGFGLSQPPRPVYDTAGHANVGPPGWTPGGLPGAYLDSNSSGCQGRCRDGVRRPDLVAVAVLVGPTVDPAAPTATGQALRWARGPARRGPAADPDHRRRRARRGPVADSADAAAQRPAPHRAAAAPGRRPGSCHA